MVAFSRPTIWFRDFASFIWVTNAAATALVVCSRSAVPTFAARSSMAPLIFSTSAWLAPAWVCTRSIAESNSVASLIDATAATPDAMAIPLKALKGIAIASGGAAVASIKLATEFDSAMERVHTQAGASQAEVEKMSGAMLDLAPKVGTGPEALAESLFHVESVGLRGAKALDTVAASAKLAK